MEVKLKEYRALRRRQQLINNAKEKLKESTDKFVNFITPNFLNEMGKENEEEVLLVSDQLLITKKDIVFDIIT
jgi:L-lysine 2,3-aminomutase